LTVRVTDDSIDNIPVANPDLQGLVRDLQEAIRQHREVNGRQGFVSNSSLLDQVNQRRWVNSHLPIGWPVMPRGIIPKLVAYAQKITRRLFRWYINPIVDQQNAFNAAVARALERLHARISEDNTLDREAYCSLLGYQEDALLRLIELEHKYLMTQQEFLSLRLEQLEKQLDPSERVFADRIDQLKRSLEQQAQELTSQRAWTRQQLEELRDASSAPHSENDK
jgi:hypothetical protein